jgi:hypothetical protein
VTGEEIVSVVFGIVVLSALIILFKYRVMPRFKGYPTTILTIEDRAAGNLFGMWDRGRRLVSGSAAEEHNYEMKNAKDKTKPAKLGFLLPTNKGDLWITYSNTVGDLKPVKIEKEKITVIDEDNRKWFTTTVRRIYDIYKPKGFWDKYGTWVMLAILILVVVGSNLMTINKIGELQLAIDKDMKEIGNIFGGVADRLGEIVKGIQVATGQTQPITPPH